MPFAAQRRSGPGVQIGHANCPPVSTTWWHRTLGGDDPSSIAGSFSDSGVRIVAPAGNAQSGTTGGNGLAADASGGDGGDGGNSTARGGKSGKSDLDSCNALLIGCFDTLGLGA